MAAGLSACAQQPQELEPLTGDDLERFRACADERFRDDPELAAIVAEGRRDDPRAAQVAIDCHRQVTQQS